MKSLSRARLRKCGGQTAQPLRGHIGHDRDQKVQDELSRLNRARAPGTPRPKPSVISYWTPSR
jgi:hypothetical protein